MAKALPTRIFINTPYDKFVGINTRFWHASGFDMQVRRRWLQARNRNHWLLLCLAVLSFQSPDDNPGPPAKEDTAFVLAENQAEALKEPDGEAEIILLNFKQSLRGLTPGAEVSFRGLVLGQVKSIGIEYDPKQQEFSMPVLVQDLSGASGPEICRISKTIKVHGATAFAVYDQSRLVPRNYEPAISLPASFILPLIFFLKPSRQKKR